MSEDNDVIFRQVGRTAAPEASGTPIPEVEVEREVSVEDHLDRLMTAWDNMDNAAQAIATSLPHQMTVSAERLESARLKTREILQAAVLAVHKSAKKTPPKARVSDTLLRFQMDDIAYFDPDKMGPLLAADALAHAVDPATFRPDTDLGNKVSRIARMMASMLDRLPFVDADVLDLEKAAGALGTDRGSKA
jgi:hypothetical protein